MLRVQISNSLIGSLVLDQSEDGLDDPKGLDTLEQTVKRSDENDGVMFEITLSLDWTKRAKSFIQSVYAVTGIESEIIVNIYERDPNARKWEFYYVGKLDMTRYSIDEVMVTMPIQQTGFQRKVLNLLDVDVDLETQFSQGGTPLPATPTVDLEYHAKKIIKGLDASPTDSNEFQQIDVFTMEFDDDNDDVYRDKVVVCNIDNSNARQKDLLETFTLPYTYTVIPGDKGSGESLEDFLRDNTNPRFEVYRATEAGVLREVDIKLRMKHKVHANNTGGDVDIGGSGCLGRVSFQAWIEHRREDNTVVSLNTIDTAWDSPGIGGTDRETDFETKYFNAAAIPVQLGDKFYVYFTGRVYGTYEEPHEGSAGHGFVHHTFAVEADKDNTFMKFTVETEFPATTHKTILVYEALKKMTQYYTDQLDSFKSTFFGRTDTVPPYPQDGKGSLMGWTVGRILRNLENKTIFANMEDAFKSLTSIWCLGAGFEVIDGVQKFVIEEKPYFYNKNLKILSLGKVNDLKKEIDLKYYYSQVEIGYPKLDAGQINGIDEANTVRRYAAPLTQAKQKLSLKSIYKASGYEIEAQRRLQGQTSDSRNDESIFMTMLRRAGLTFATARNENFTIVNNLFDPNSAYNLEISPARNAMRWVTVLAAPLWAVADKIYKFSYGETNYQMETQKVDEMTLVKEGQNLNVNTVTPLWYPEKYSFTHPLTRDQFSLIRQNTYGYIEFQDSLANKLEGYILEVGHKPNEKLGTFKLLRVFR